MTATRASRFWPKVDKSGGPEACWPWTASRNLERGGYGQFGCERAHRVALELSGVDVPTGAHVLHSCDNPPCCNPTHLRIGSNTENIADMRSRARDIKGSQSHLAKLTEADSVEIRRLYASGTMLQREIALRFGVNQVQVSRAIRGKTWKHTVTKPWVAPDKKKSPRGRENARAKLTDEIVAEIRQRHAAGELQRELAVAFNVGQTTISRVVLHAGWAHVK